MSVEYKSSMVKVAKQIIKKETPSFEGIYALVSLIMKFEAEIDNLPLGKAREYCRVRLLTYLEFY